MHVDIGRFAPVLSVFGPVVMEVMENSKDLRPKAKDQSVAAILLASADVIQSVSGQAASIG